MDGNQITWAQIKSKLDPLNKLAEENDRRMKANIWRIAIVAAVAVSAISSTLTVLLTR